MKDNFSTQSTLYARYRPAYPQELYDFILKQVPAKEAAWDCGTGNGQAAKQLAVSFEKVFATDISQKQIDNAVQLPAIYYSVQPAEQTDFPDNSFDLIIVAQALHWFRFDDFYKEVKRVGKANSFFSAWTYSLLKVTKEIDALIEHHHYTTLHNFWDKERKYVDEEYKKIPFPFKRIKTPVFHIESDWTMDELEGYLNTWSALQKFIAVKNYNPVNELIEKIRPFWKTEKMKVVFPIHVLAGVIEK